MFKRFTIYGFLGLLVLYILFSVGAYLLVKREPLPDLPGDNVTLPIFETDETPEPSETPVQPDPPVTQEPSAPSFEPDTEPEPEQEEDPPEEEPPDLGLTSLPVRMRIPALSLDYEIRPTGADKNGTMQIVPALAVISWFDRSSIPGNSGNAILGGHNTWKGERSRIYSLDKLEIGDELEIEYEDGTVHMFYMESVFVYLLATAPADKIMDTGGEARLTLITCKPPFNTSTGTSDNRIVATFREESVFVIPDPPIEPFPPKEVA